MAVETSLSRVQQIKLAHRILVGDDHRSSPLIDKAYDRTKPVERWMDPSQATELKETLQALGIEMSITPPREDGRSSWITISATDRPKLNAILDEAQLRFDVTFGDDDAKLVQNIAPVVTGLSHEQIGVIRRNIGQLVDQMSSGSVDKTTLINAFVEEALYAAALKANAAEKGMKRT